MVRAMATRCRWPPDKLSWKFARMSGQAPGVFIQVSTRFLCSFSVKVLRRMLTIRSIENGEYPDLV